MPPLTPIPTKSNVLARLRDHVPITSIVDVGVRERTSELIACFPDKKHYLFEPVTLFVDAIKNNYRQLLYELFPIALTNENSELYLILTSLDNDGVATHSRISPTPLEPDGRHTLSCLPAEVRRFDALEVAKNIAPNFLLKVDVDGQDLNVVRGFGDKLALASIVIIECTYASMIERITFLQTRGFSIVDMVDLVYYGETLYQFDAVLVRHDLITPQLRPPIQSFVHDLWRPVRFS